MGYTHSSVTYGDSLGGRFLGYLHVDLAGSLGVLGGLDDRGLGMKEYTSYWDVIEVQAKHKVQQHLEPTWHRLLDQLVAIGYAKL